MKILKSQLRQIIREESQKINEGEDDGIGGGIAVSALMLSPVIYGHLEQIMKEMGLGLIEAAQYMVMHFPQEAAHMVKILLSAGAAGGMIHEENFLEENKQMKILKSQLRQIIKEEYDRMLGEEEESEPEGYGVFFGKRSYPHERRRFKTKAEAEAAMAAMRKESPYSAKSFDAGGIYGMEVRPYNPQPEAGPAPIAASPEEVESKLAELDKMLRYHDWYYERADDSRFYHAGRMQSEKIRDEMSMLKRMGAGEQADALYNKHHGAAFGR